MSIDRDQALRILDNALWRVAHRGDCEYHDTRGRPKPCDCPHCTALAALAAASDWRFHGSFFDRVQSDHWPRGRKMHAAWKKLASDTLLSNILRDSVPLSPRDWYVATSVVQWLATNVGSTVLEAAGFKYVQDVQDDQDRADVDLLKRRQEGAP